MDKRFNGDYEKNLFTPSLYGRPVVSDNKRAEINATYDRVCTDCGVPECHWWLNSKAENYPDAEISYTFNNYGYRCDDFNKDDACNNFLFAGCSYTFGVGLPYTNTWAHSLNRLLKKDKFFNIGINGAGYEQIINDVYAYINEFGKPKGLFIMFPNLERDLILPHIDNERILFYDHYSVNKKDWDEKLKFPNYQWDILCIKFYKQMLHLEQYCRDLNIPLLWTTWNQPLDKSIMARMKFDNYITVWSFNDVTKKYAIDNQHYLGWSKKYWFNARDCHSGAQRHFNWRNLFNHYWKERYADSHTAD